MSKKNDNLLALPPLGSDESATDSTTLVPWSPRGSLTTEEKRVIDLYGKHRLLMGVIAEKARYGTSLIGEIHKHGSLTFDEATSHIMEVKDRSGRSELHQAYIDQFTERQIQLLARQSLGAIEVGATSIGFVIHEDSDPPPLPEPRSGFLQRLLGG